MRCYRCYKGRKCGKSTKKRKRGRQTGEISFEGSGENRNKLMTNNLELTRTHLHDTGDGVKPRE